MASTHPTGTGGQSLDIRAQKKKVFLRWVVHYVAPYGITVTDLVEDMRDGTVLLLLLKVLTGKDPTPNWKAPTTPKAPRPPGEDEPQLEMQKTSSGAALAIKRADRITNVHNGLLFLSRNAKGVSLSHLSAEDIVNGKMKSIFDLVYELVREFELRKLLGARLAVGADLGSLEHQCQALIRLVSDTLAHYVHVDLNAFPHDFADGLCLAALLHATEYTLIDLYSIVVAAPGAPRRGEALLDHAMGIAHTLGVPRLIDASDATSLSSECFITYFATALNIMNDRAPSPDDRPLALAQVRELVAENSRLKAAAKVIQAKLASVDDHKRELAAEFDEASAEKDATVRAARAEVDDLSTRLNELRSQLATAVAANARLQASLDTLVQDSSAAAVASSGTAVSPPEGVVALVATRIYGASALWDASPEVMVAAESLLLRLVRTLLVERSGYEVSCSDGSLLIAFSSALSAVAFCMRVQIEAIDLPWPERLASLHPDFVATEQSMDRSTIFRGLRLGIGVHVGRPTLKSTAVTSSGVTRAVYVGGDVTLTKWLAQAAAGGQTVLTHKAYGAVAKSLHTLDLRVHEESLGKFEVSGEIQATGQLFSLLPEFLVHRRFPQLRLKGSASDAADAAKNALSATERKYRLLQERNAALNNSLKTLSAQVGSANEYALRLASKLRSINSNSGTDKELASLVAELDSVMSRQDKLSSQLAMASAERDVLNYELTEVKDTLVSERNSIAADMAAHARSDLETEAARDADPGSGGSHMMYNHNPKLVQQIEELQLSLRKATRAAAAKEIGLKEQLRTTRKQLEAAQESIRVLDFKLQHNIYTDPEEAVPLDDVLNDSNLPENFPHLPGSAASGGGGPAGTSLSPHASRHTRRHSVSHGSQSSIDSPTHRSETGIAGLPTLPRIATESDNEPAAVQVGTRRAHSEIEWSKERLVELAQQKKARAHSRSRSRSRSRSPTRSPPGSLDNSAASVRLNKSAAGALDASLSNARGLAGPPKINKRVQTKHHARVAVAKVLNVIYTRPLQEMYSTKTELAQGHALALLYDTLTSALSTLLALFPGTIDFLYSLKLFVAALDERYKWLHTARSDVKYDDIVDIVHGFCEDIGVLADPAVASKFNSFFRPPEDRDATDPVTPKSPLSPLSPLSPRLASTHRKSLAPRSPNSPNAPLIPRRRRSSRA
ncbi:uncharacterized protein AMSG_08041 [Thecamonas trahens ATCC 50062]|uniref:Calponin-homology (CH) domain-containing protein n=1 Tax=Thecamonas trahens ATCC 50062 TaxID=461836 RepID=A0A0L0DJA1_THETB|nr:hypothetical protein AMSG_08041 [Thecamonas trahens ATCC 50062]KNC52484.1 hypothetical protein AMSG_08041 [Thecamonas trahens ATCC 50062]|eukprot:XP_013755281.1 hypothetical protein AMSG_08041 [Thecamonas trahens ATCC 50062]